MQLAAVFLILSSLLTLLLVYIWFSQGKCNAEGFKDSPENIKKKLSNPLLTMVSKLTKMTKHFASVETWRDRIETAFMSPTDLARRYIQKQKATSS